jgi:hypothetical protein
MFDDCNGFIKWNMVPAVGQTVADLPLRATYGERPFPGQSRDERSRQLSSST